MRRTWPWWVRVVVSVAIVVLAYRPYAGCHWSDRVATGPGLAAYSPTNTGIYRKSLMAVLVDRITHIGWKRGVTSAPFWRLSYTLAKFLPASLIGVIVFAALTRRYGPRPEPDPYTRCRKCGYILCGLSRPRCPECGEPI